jgi:hypothetical protein
MKMVGILGLQWPILRFFMQLPVGQVVQVVGFLLQPLISNPGMPGLSTSCEVMVLPCDVTAVCHDSKTKKLNRQSFFNFQENLNGGE